MKYLIVSCQRYLDSSFRWNDSIKLLSMLFLLFTTPAYATATTTPWIVYYSDKASAESFQPYTLIVFDSDYHPPLEPLLQNNKTILGYISLGELEKERGHFPAALRSGIALTENVNWPGSFVIDIRRSEWRKMVINTLIPDLLNKGFNGIFLDTLDSPLALEGQNPRYYAGMKESAIHLIKTIRHRYPNLKIMVNRAYEILPDIAPYIDMELGESIYSDYNFRGKYYKRVKQGEYQRQVDILHHAKRINPKLTVFTLDYWNPNDKAGIKNIYITQQKNGFHPYVSTVLLNKVMEPPQ